MVHKAGIFKSRRSFSIMITVAMIAALFAAFTIFPDAAVGETGREKDYMLTDGVWESTVYVTESRGNNVRVHILKINQGSNIALKVSNASYYAKGSNAAKRKNATVKWGYAKVVDQAKNYESTKDALGTVVAGVNGDFYLKGEYNGRTEGKLIMEGNVINPSSKEPFFAVLKNGSYAFREGNADTSDVQEAVAGYMWVLKDGVNNGKKAPQVWDTVSSIGLTSSGDVIIVSVDGRESSSVGMTVYDLGVLMKKQGCRNAILLDCGGSATFVTKRPSNKSLVLRNVPNDGLVREVSSSILVVKKSAAGSKPKTNKAASKMIVSKTKLTKKNGYYHYKIAGKKASGFKIINNEQYLFDKKGKGLTKTIKLGDTKYYYKKGKLTKTSDKKAGRVAIGFCGASKDGQNLLYAYHYGDKKLNIGLNPLVKGNTGKMKDWTNVIYVPWASEGRHIKKVNIGYGVKNVGKYAFYISRKPFNEAARKFGSKLSSVSLPSSLTTIGYRSIYNNKKLKKMKIPSSVKYIKSEGLAYNENAQYTFKSTAPPKFSSNVFKTTGKKTVIKAPATTKWKKLLKSSKQKKRIGFKGKVRF